MIIFDPSLSCCGVGSRQGVTLTAQLLHLVGEQAVRNRLGPAYEGERVRGGGPSLKPQLSADRGFVQDL